MPRSSRSRKAEPPDYTIAYDPARRRLHVNGRDFESDLTDVGRMVRRGVIGSPAEVVYTDATNGVAWIIRHRCLDTLLGIWGVAPASGGL